MKQGVPHFVDGGRTLEPNFERERALVQKHAEAVCSTRTCTFGISEQLGV